MLKVYFNAYEPEDIWEDWTEYLSDISTITKNIESDNVGEPGLEVYDSVNLSFHIVYENRVYNVFNNDLMATEKLLIRVSFSNKTIFEGVIDFSSIKYLANGIEVSFDVYDKLSAMNILTENSIRDEWRINDVTSPKLPHLDYAIGEYYSIDLFDQQNANNEIVIHIYEHKNLGGGVFSNSRIHLTEPLFESGEIIRVVDGDVEKLYCVKDAWLIWTGSGESRYSDSQILQGCDLSDPSLISSFTITGLDPDDVGYGGKLVTYYKKELYGVDCFNYEDIVHQDVTYQKLTNISLAKLLKAITSKIWPATVVSGLNEFNISLSWWPQLITTSPLGEHPLEAIRLIASSVAAYIRFDNNSVLTVNPKSNLSAFELFDISAELKKYDDLSYVWDKIVDAVTITAKSWLQESGSDLTGEATSEKFPGLKARNPLSKTIFVPEEVEGNQEALNEYAQIKADEYLNFYGKRHYALSVTIPLNSNTANLDLLKRINIKLEYPSLLSEGLDFFVASMEIDTIEETIALELVSVQGYEYTFGQMFMLKKG